MAACDLYYSSFSISSLTIALLF